MRTTAVRTALVALAALAAARGVAAACPDVGNDVVALTGDVPAGLCVVRDLELAVVEDGDGVMTPAVFGAGRALPNYVRACSDYDAWPGNFVVRMHMGIFTDHYFPAGTDKTYCDLVQSSLNHMHSPSSNLGAPFTDLPPASQHSDDGHLAGSSIAPAHMSADVRNYVPFFGGPGTRRGGCCYEADVAPSSAWGMSYVAYVMPVTSETASGDATLEHLRVDAVDVPSFDPAVRRYEVALAPGVSSLSLDARAADAGATVRFDADTPAALGEREPASLAVSGLRNGVNVLNVIVRAESHLVEHLYTVEVTVSGVACGAGTCSNGGACLGDGTCDCSGAAGFGGPFCEDTDTGGAEMRVFRTGHALGHADSDAYCVAQGFGGLCPSSEVCPGGSPSPLVSALGLLNTIDKWTPVADSEGEFVQIADLRLCGKLSEYVADVTAHPLRVTSADATPVEAQYTRDYVACCRLPTDNTLESLVPASGELTPAFDPLVTSYTLEVEDGPALLEAVFPSGSTDVAFVGGDALASGEASAAPLTGDVSVVTVRATPRYGGGAARDYTVTVSLTCTDAAAPPQFDVAGSTITAGDDLLLKWTSARQYESHEFVFVGAETDDACSMQSPQNGVGEAIDEEEWARAPDAESCADEWTFTRSLDVALGACGFAKLEDDPLFTEFRATVEVTTVEDTGAEVFGQAVKQTRTTATEFGVRVPKAVSVTSDDVQAFPGFAGLEVDGRSFAVVSTQAYDVAEEEFTLRVITAVAWPYVLELDGTTPVERTSGSNTWTLGASNKGGDCDSGAAVDNVCVQQWDLTLDRISDCEVDGTYSLNFDVRCSNAFGNGDGCETHENPTASIAIPVESDSVCARVVEVATVTPTLVTSTTQGGAQATDFVLQTTLFGRVSVAAEGGIATTAVVLTDLEIDSTCTSCAGSDGDKRNPFSDASPLASTYAWSTTPGTTFADFEFQLNTNSVPFDTGAGQASITLTATVAVTYDEAGDQRTETRRVQMQAGGGETVSARASANFGVGTQSGAAPSSGASSSAAVSGTVAVAAFVAIVAVVAGAAVVVRKRRAAASKRASAVTRSSSTTDVAAPAAVHLDMLPPARAYEGHDLPPGAVVIDPAAPSHSVRDVCDAYSTIVEE